MRLGVHHRHARASNSPRVVVSQIKNRFDEFVVKICHGGWCAEVVVVGQRALFTGLPFLSRLRSPSGPLVIIPGVMTPVTLADVPHRVASTAGWYLGEPGLVFSRVWWPFPSADQNNLDSFH
jgi:hypothetical protein